MTLCTLNLEFDINQITRSLQFGFSNTEKKSGSLAGTFNFNGTDDPENDLLQVAITVTGSSAGNPSVTIQDCTLVSVSNGNLGRTFLSPFSETNAVSHVTEGWTPWKDKKAPAGRVKLTCKANKGFPVVARKGQWEISGYLSVGIIWEGKSYNRVFTFDPEGTAGGGGGLGWPA